MRVCVIGAGVVGCACALELRREGFDVTVVDRNGEVGHGSTSASSAIVRRFYSQPAMVAMAHEGACTWAEWGDYLGPIDDDLAVFRRPGMLLIPAAMDEGIMAIVHAMRAVGIVVDVLSPDELVERFPYLNASGQHPPKDPADPEFFEDSGRRIEGAIFERGAGHVVSPGLATHNLKLAAVRDGVRFLLKREVKTITSPGAGGDHDGSGTARFSLGLSNGEALEADVVINVAGPHSSVINRMAGVQLPLQTRALRHEVHLMANPVFDSHGGTPVVGDLDSGVYWFPEAGGRQVLVGSTDPACDQLEWVDDPDDYRVTPTEAYWERQCLRLMKRFDGMGLGRKQGIAALYDVTVKDWYPIVDRTDLPGFYVAIGTSGSSFKTSPVIGQIMARLVATNEGGGDTDRTPLSMTLPRSGIVADVSVLSRNRGEIVSTGTVIG